MRKVGRSMDIGPSRHPLATKVNNLRAMTKNQPIVKPAITNNSQTIKQEAIAEAFKKLDEHQKEEKITPKRQFKFITIFCIIVGIIFLIAIGWIIYINMPTLSVNVASAQAGINATYPEYRPDGYNINGPVSYSDGQVTITFRANTGNSQFVINQSKSSWDSSAVKNQVTNDAKGEPITTTEERGLTIYTYSGNAAWVNGGILYTIKGNAKLSGDQIRQIATSL